MTSARSSPWGRRHALPTGGVQEGSRQDGAQSVALPDDASPVPALARCASLTTRRLPAH